MTSRKAGLEIFQNLSSLKHQILSKCRAYVDARISTARQAMHEAQAAANEESKSSVGDKYETGRSMMQIEGEKAAHQLAEAMKLKEVLDRLSLDARGEKIVLGSLVITDIHKVFISIGLGKLNLDGEDILVVAPTSPLGKLLMGRTVNDSVSFNNQLITILDVA